MKIGGSTQHQSQSSQSGPDAQTQAYVTQIMNLARGAGYNGPGSTLTGANNYFSGLEGAGATGAAALGGDAGAVASLMNPYQQQVIDAMNKQFATSNQGVANQLDANATAAGAFGGSRADVAKGAALAANQQNQNAQIAQLLSGGYSNAMNQAATAAGLGLQGAQGGVQLGSMGIDNPALWQMLMLKGGFMGLPYGTTSSGTSNGNSGSAGFSLFGG